MSSILPPSFLQRLTKVTANRAIVKDRTMEVTSVAACSRGLLLLLCVPCIGQDLPLRALPDSIESSPCGARAVIQHNQTREQQHTLNRKIKENRDQVEDKIRRLAEKAIQDLNRVYSDKVRRGTLHTWIGRAWG